MLTSASGATSDQLTSLVCGLLDAAGLTPEQKLEALGGAFVAEAVRPHWAQATAAEEAHDALRLADDELADAVEAVAQVLLGRSETREVALDALAELDVILGAQQRSEAERPAQAGLFDS
jgi:hypothetical protein